MATNTSPELVILESQSSLGADNVSESLIVRFEKWMISNQKMNLKQKLIFFRLLATMVNSGLPVLKAIGILEKQEKNLVIKNYYTKTIAGIRSGHSLSDTLRGFGTTFGEAECSIIESGEKTGKLNSALIQLAEQSEKISSISPKIKGAMIYPAMIVVVMLGSIGVLMTMVVPKLIEIFGDRDKLPMSTQMLIGVSDFMVAYWWAMLIGIFLALGILSIWKETPSGKFQFHKFLLKFPIIGALLQKVILSKFSRVLSNLLSNGISIVESLRIVSEVVDNEVYRQRILLLREDVKRGVKIGESLEDDALFPDILVQMIKVGEETSKTDTIILKIADFYDEEVDTTVTGMNKILEPIIIVTMAVVVGVIAIGILQPIMQLSDVISQQ